MLVYKCDRCDKTVTDIINIHAVQMTDCNDMLRFDLCNNCYKTLVEWLKIKIVTPIELPPVPPDTIIPATKEGDGE